MRTLTEIKYFVAKDYLYHDYKTALDLFKKGAISEISFNEFVDDILKEVAKESLKNASENATTTQVHKTDGIFDIYKTVVDKQSILNESNIPDI